MVCGDAVSTTETRMMILTSQPAPDSSSTYRPFIPSFRPSFLCHQPPARLTLTARLVRELSTDGLASSARVILVGREFG